MSASSNPPKDSGRFLRKLLVGTVTRSQRHAFLVIAVAVGLAALSAFYIVRHFGINTNVTQLLFKEGKVTRLNRELARDFPSLRRRIIIVVHGKGTTSTAQAVRTIVSLLHQHPRSYPFVYAPAVEPVFTRDGLLYLKTPQLRKVLERLTLAEPFLGPIINQPDIRGYVRLLRNLIRNTQRIPLRAQPIVKSIINKNNVLIDNHRISPEVQESSNPNVFGDITSLKSADLQTSPVIVSLPPSAETASGARNAVHRLKKLLEGDSSLRKSDARWTLTGSVILGLDQLKDVTTGTDLATALSLLLSILLLIFGLRSVRLLLPILITLLAGLLYTAAFALLALGPLNLISVAFGVLFIGLGVDFSIQFCIRLQEEMAKQASIGMAYNATAYRIGFALILAALASASCFYAVIPTGYSGIRDLGIIAGTGALIALVLNLTLLPALLTTFRAGRVTIARPPIPFSKLPVHKLGRPALILSIVLIAVSVALIPRLDFDFDLAHLENPNSKAVRVLHQLEKKVGFSPYTLEAVAPNLTVANRWADAARRLPSVGRVLTLLSYVPGHQDKKLAMISNVALLYPPPFLQPASLSTPKSKALRDCRLLNSLGELAARHISRSPAYFRVDLERFSRTLRKEFGAQCSPGTLALLRSRIVTPLAELGRRVVRLLNPSRVTLATLPRSVRADYLAPNGQARVEIFSRLDLHRSRNLQTFVAQVGRVIPNIGGTPVLFVRGGAIVISAFREASLLAFLFIVLVISFVLRSVRDVALTIIPLLISVALTLATMALLDLHFNIANIIVIPLSIGLSVAFGIYVILRWKNNHYDIRQVLRSSVPEGILVSGMTTLLVFGTLVLTPSPGLHSLGLTLVIALFWTLVSSLVVLPSILSVVETPLRPRPSP